MNLVTGAMGSLLPKLAELLKDEYKLKKAVKEGVISLQNEMKSMHAALRKVAEVPHNQLDEQVKLWAEEVRELSFDMEDIVDKFLVRVEDDDSEPATKLLSRLKQLTKKMAGLCTKGKARNQIANAENKLNQLTEKMVGLFTKGKALKPIADAIKDINRQVQEVANRRERYNIDNIVARVAPMEIIYPRVQALYTEASKLVGIVGKRDQELMNLLSEGDGDSVSTKKLKVVSVVGFGGLGKTTLVEAVYDRIKGGFDCTAFVPVSRNADARNVFIDILHDLGMYESHLTMFDERQLIDKLRERLENKRYLIVIDDLWDDKIWSIISLCLPSNDCGSRVITTTRVIKIAEECCSYCKDLIYEIRPLGYQNSKILFLKACFGSEESGNDAQTEFDEILKICGGIPLAILGIASEIRLFPDRNITEAVMKSLHSWHGDLHYLEKLRSILLYSYFDLPFTLRVCLLYLAASAKNQRVQRDNLVSKWIAEELIPINKGGSHEDVARAYFDELINRNMIQPVKYVNCLGKETYEVNYVMLSALRLLSQEENFATFLSESGPEMQVKPFRLFMQCSGSDHSINTERVNLTSVLSVTMLGPANWVPFKHLNRVRVLDLDGCNGLDNSAMENICLMIWLKYLSLKQTQVTEIPPEISNLQRLETLAIKNCQITTLPPQIGKLKRLETLDVSHTQLKVLPKEVLQLPKITHLHFGQSGSFGVKLPLERGQLRSVKMMGYVDSRECSESAMEEISELMEVQELEVVLYDGPADMEQNDKLLSFVGKCRNLESLTIYGDCNPSDTLPLQSPSFPRLEKLKVAGRLLKVPGWIAQLRTLTLLVIRVWKLEENDLVIIGGLPYLSVLSLALVARPREQVTITGSAGFARLEVFCFDCRVPWVSFEEKAMPRLKHLQLKLYSAPAGKLPSGIMLLESLNMVILLYSSHYATSVGVIEAVDAVRRDAASHANQIELSINGDQEIFLSNKSADRGFAGTSADGGAAPIDQLDTCGTTGAEIVEVLASE